MLIKTFPYSTMAIFCKQMTDCHHHDVGQLSYIILHYQSMWPG